MADQIFRFPTGGKYWAAACIHDERQNLNQAVLNETTAQVKAAAVAANAGKLLGIGEDGAIQAVELSAWTGGSY